MSGNKQNVAVAGWPEGRLFLGFDVAKAEVAVVAVDDGGGMGRARRIANTPQALLAFLAEIGPSASRWPPSSRPAATSVSCAPR